MKFKGFLDARAELKTQFQHQSHNLGIALIYEDIIKPGIVSLPSLDIDKLNIQYNSAGIFFHKADKKKDYRAYYDPATKEIHVSFNGVSIEEVEAILSHELVHKEQHKKYPGWEKKMEDEVTLINRYVSLHNKAPDDMKPKIHKAYNKLLDKFQYGSPQEKMAYALQFVKERKKYGYKHPNDIAKKYKEILHFDNQFKKYLGMYWLIKDTI